MTRGEIVLEAAVRMGVDPTRRSESLRGRPGLGQPGGRIPEGAQLSLREIIAISTSSGWTPKQSASTV